MEDLTDVNDASSDSFDEYMTLLDRIRGNRRDLRSGTADTGVENLVPAARKVTDVNNIQTAINEHSLTAASNDLYSQVMSSSTRLEGDIEKTVKDQGVNSKYEDSSDNRLMHASSEVYGKRPVLHADTSSSATSKEEFQHKKAKPCESEKTMKLSSKEEREFKKTQKEQEKKRKQVEKEEKLKQKNRDKALKKAETLTRRTEKLDECIKNVVAVLDPKVVSEDGSHILQSLEEMGVQYDVKALPMESSIGWMRSMVSYDVNEECEITRKDDYIEENMVLLKIKAADFAQMSLKMLAGFDACCSSLNDFIAKAEDSFPGKSITMVVYGMEAYFKQQKTAENRKFVNRVRNTAPNSKQREDWISKSDLEQVLVSTQLRYGHSIYFCERAEELGKFVSSFTKSVAESPFKRKESSSLSFYGGAALKSQGGQCGSSVHDVWMKQLQQFTNVSYDIASAIVRQYPCPKSLMEAYQNCADEASAKGMISDIEVRRGHGSLATTRRVGIEVSKKLHGLFTSVDAHEMLAK